jgi:predicted CXXCH cytochrome family protein
MRKRQAPRMAAGRPWRWRVLLLLAVCAVVAVAFALLAPRGGLAVRGEGTAAPDGTGWSPDSSDEPCLKCHRDPDLSMTFPSGEALSLTFDVETFRESVHGDRLDCIDCHQRHREYPHPPLGVLNRRDYARAEYEACKRCHFENYTRTLDSMHFDAMAEGNADAAICTDCHTAHAVTQLEESRTEIVETCSECHDDIYQDYAQSVHGAALSDENPDVPDCIVCHGVHNIASATTAAFRRESVDLCAECHADKALMDKYDISSRLLETYLDDFHGKTVGFYQKESAEVWPDVAVCTDCHGVHDIKSVDDPESSVIKENLVTTCRKCHADATSNFPSAWLSHYEPTIDKASLVFFIRQYYMVLIPAMVVGLALNVLLDLWRLARNR